MLAVDAREQSVIEGSVMIAFDCQCFFQCVILNGFTPCDFNNNNDNNNNNNNSNNTNNNNNNNNNNSFKVI